MTRSPYKHQVEGAKWLLNSRNRIANGVRHRGAILADDMGLGKSLTALLAVKVHKAADPTCKVVVICPKGLMSNWKNEARHAGVHLDLVCTNHAKSFPEGQEGNFVVICDEAHAMQAPNSQRTKKFLALVNGSKEVTTKIMNGDTVVREEKHTVRTGNACQSVYLLTGTPIKNGRPHNLLPLLQAINHGLVINQARVKDYLFRFCGPEFNGFGWTFNGATHLDELHDLCQPSILRRMAEDCLDLPELTRTNRQVELTPEEDRAYNGQLNDLRNDYLRRLTKGEIKNGGEKIVLLGQLRLAGSLAKVSTAIELAEEVIEEGGQVVIFTAYVESAKRIADHFQVPAFTGETSNTQRDKIVADFQENRQKVFVGTNKAGGVGLTLHAHGKCRTVILVDRPWTPGDALQLEKRVLRIGQPNAVLAVWLQHGQVDYTVDNILLEKSENIAQVLTGERSSFITFGEGDMADAVTDALGW